MYQGMDLYNAGSHMPRSADSLSLQHTQEHIQVEHLGNQEDMNRLQNLEVIQDTCCMDHTVMGHMGFLTQEVLLKT
jgi:delta-aminolevulinic acid dehydratase/porphobilinogen synthase